MEVKGVQILFVEGEDLIIKYEEKPAPLKHYLSSTELLHGMSRSWVGIQKWSNPVQSDLHAFIPQCCPPRSPDIF